MSSTNLPQYHTVIAHNSSAELNTAAQTMLNNGWKLFGETKFVANYGGGLYCCQTFVKNCDDLIIKTKS